MQGTLLGHYRVGEKLGSGGMGDVYRAHDEGLNRDVAVKILRDGLVSDRNRLARFQHEAQALAALNHPNIAQIYGLERRDGNDRSGEVPVALFRKTRQDRATGARREWACGKRIAQYEIRQLLGRGGMGVVCAAYDTRLTRLVALKFLPEHVCQNRSARGLAKAQLELR